MRPLFQQSEPSKKFRTPSRTEQRRRRLGFEACESRLMMSADPVSLSPAEHTFAAPAAPHLGEFLASSAAFQGSAAQLAPISFENPSVAAGLAANTGLATEYHGPVEGSQDLTVTVSDSTGGESDTNTNGMVTPGQTLTYTVQVSNVGWDTVQEAGVDDELPSDFTGASWTATSVGGATGFSPEGTGDLRDVVTLMPPDSWVTYTITGTVSSTATGMLSNRVVVESAAITPAPGNVWNASATDNDTVAGPNLTVVSSDNAGGSANTTGEVMPGQLLTYTVVVSNTGTTAAVGTTVADSLPSDFHETGWTATGIGGANDSTSIGTGEIDDTLMLPPGSSVIYVITGTVSSTAQGWSTLSNTATVTLAGGTPISATDNDTVIGIELPALGTGLSLPHQSTLVSELTNNAVTPPSAASGSTGLNGSAVDAVLAGHGEHQFSSLLDDALAGDTGDSRSTRTPSTSSFAALADSALVDFEPLFHSFV